MTNNQYPMPLPLPPKKKHISAWLLMATGERIRLEGHFTLEFFQKMVGGYVQVVYTKDDRQMWMNEEGRGLALPCNHEATDLYGRNMMVCGDVVVMDAGMESR